jgi:hypothetical protein
MARLFITPREIDFISDIVKELTKDIVGQKIYFYKILDEVTKIHDVYEEALDKVFNAPVEIECLVDWKPDDVRANRFGSEEVATIEAYIQSRELIDRDIDLREGDYFSYGQIFFEVTSIVDANQTFGQVEYKTGIKLTGKQARRGQINHKPIGPTDEIYTDDDAVQTEFVQQRGYAENKNGITGDTRRLKEQGKVEAISGPSEVSDRGDSSGVSSSFYDEE